MSFLKEELESYDPMEAFTYALKAPESKRQYPRRFKPFLDFLNLEGSVNEQAKQFWIKAKENPMWAQNKQGDYGLNPIGYAVLMRYRRGQNFIRIT